MSEFFDLENFDEEKVNAGMFVYILVVFPVTGHIVISYCNVSVFKFSGFFLHTN